MPSDSHSRQIIGNIGLFHVCHELSKRGFNVVPTSRNTRAADMIVGSADFSKYATIQVKTRTDNEMGIRIGTKSQFPEFKDALKDTSSVDFWVYVRISNDYHYATKSVFVWRGNDKLLIREMRNDYWYEPMNQSKRIDNKVKKRWEKRKDENGWELFTKYLNR